MAGSCIVAIESRKHAARRPRPPFPRPASGSCSSTASQSRPFSSTTRLDEWLEEQIQDVVGQGAPDQELHGEVVDPLGILALVGLLGAQPPLREDIPERASGGLVALRGPSSRRIHDVVEQEVTLVKRVARAGEPDRTAPVPLEQPVQGRRA